MSSIYSIDNRYGHHLPICDRLGSIGLLGRAAIQLSLS
jgi:hypothetical protein